MINNEGYIGGGKNGKGRADPTSGRPWAHQGPWHCLWFWSLFGPLWYLPLSLPPLSPLLSSLLSLFFFSFSLIIYYYAEAGGVYSWGQSWLGQTGLDTSGFVSTPTLVTLPTSSTFQISAGGHVSLAITGTFSLFQFFIIPIIIVSLFLMLVRFLYYFNYFGKQEFWDLS